MIQRIINSNSPCFFISPHLDDAIFSAGGLMSQISNHVPVNIVNVFTNSGNAKNTLSAKAFLRQVNVLDANKLFEIRKKEDKEAADFLNANVENLNEVDALWREKYLKYLNTNSLPLPELGRIYPTYRFHIIKGKIKKTDNVLVNRLVEKLKGLNHNANSLFFCPVGFGNHVDHAVVREACVKAIPSQQLIFWSDFPYIARPKSDTTFLRKNSLTSFIVSIDLKKKTQACRLYESQFMQVIGDENLLKDTETFYSFNNTEFPIEINRFSLSHEFQAEDAMSNYIFAIYKDEEGKEYFVKKYRGPKNSRAYKFLVNEINTYKFLNSSNEEAEIDVPKLVFVEENKEDLYMFIEFVNGKTIKNKSIKEKAKIFEKVILFFKSKNIKNISPDFPIVKRGPHYWAALLPIVSLIAIIKNRKQFLIIVKAFILALSGIPAMLSRSERGLIHRDFNDHNAIVKNGKIYPIDFQLASVADPIVERAIMFLKYFDNPEMISEIKKTQAMKLILNDSKQNKTLNTYLLLFSIYDQCLADGNHNTSLKCLKALTNNIK